MQDEKISTIFILIIFIVIISLFTNCSKRRNLTKYVDPRIGTGIYAKSGAMGHCNNFPGPALPHGMVQLSPDTGPYKGDFPNKAGYSMEDDSIEGFSHTHVTGTGCPGFGNFLVMPLTGEKGWDESEYRSSFNRNSEKISTGYYKVKLQDYDIDAELTATKRAGMHRYTFPSSDSSHIIFDVTHNLATHQPQDAKIKVVNQNTLKGSVTIPKPFCWGKSPFTLYFTAKVSKPFSSFQTWKDSTLLSHKALEGTDDIGAILTYSTSHNEKILLKMGLSYVNAKQAEINLEKEIPDWNFARIRNQAQKIWNKKLNKIKVQGGTRKDKVKFYTALYHAMLGPYTASDVNGKYKGMDNKIHTAKDRNHYHFYSLWDTFRSLHPLLNLIEPEQQSDMVASLLAKQEHGGWLPKWEFANRYTNCMIADHATSVISESILKGVDDFNVEKAYQAMKKNALRMPRDGKIAVLSNGNFTPLQIGEKQAHVIGPTDTLSFDWKWKYNDNNFHHYLLKYQKDQNISVYIDQKKIATSQKFSGKIFSKQNLVLGINPDSIEANKYFTGKLDEIAIYPKALDQKQIQQLSQGQQIKNMNSIYRSNCNSLQELSALNIKGSPKFTRGRFQKAVVLDGIDDRIKIETKSIDSSFTISFWFKTSLPSDFMGRAGLDHYIEKGYIPSDVDWRGWGSVSTTLENAYNDYALAKVANKLGKQEDYQYFQQRAQNYGNLFDTTTGFMRPKKSNGGWEKPFDPRSWKEFTEGNAWSYTWFVPHHVKGLIGLMGKNLFIQRLDTIFSKFTYPEWHEEFIHYWHGNEPSQQVPYLYNYVGQSWKTQRVVRKIMDELYSTRRNGIPGNEDVGQLSAWFALSAMGFHPVAPAKSTYLLGSPLFDKVVIDLDKDYYSGSKFTITTENNSKQNKYIQRIQINNKEIEETWFKHSVIQKGGTIKLKMGSRPNKKQ